MPDASPVVAIVGPTAVGKTALAVALAQRFDGEIVNADSRQVYVDMDIGTAKPTAAELESARHHLINVRRPNQPISLGEYLPLARETIADITGRDKLPVICGGTGQYVWALLEGWQVPRVPPDPELRAKLEARAESEGAASLWQELRSLDAARAEAIGRDNLRRIIRALEIRRLSGPQTDPNARNDEPPYRRLIIGLTAERRSLYARIDARFDAMMEKGLLDEARRLDAQGYVLGEGPLSGVGYTQLGQYLSGEMSLPDAVARAKTQTHRLVRQQYNWFKPTDPRIAWLDATDDLPIEDASRHVRAFLAAQTRCGTIPC